MKNQLIFMFVLLFLTTQNSIAQININTNSKCAIERQLDIGQLEGQKKVVERREKEKLKEEIKKINKDLEKGVIADEEAEELKKLAAEKRAQNIQEQTEVIDANISLLKRNNMKEWDYYSKLTYLFPDKKEDGKVVKSDSLGKGKNRQISATLRAGWGFNNTIAKGQSLNDSPYSIGRSQHFEIGLIGMMNLTKKGNFNVNVGFSFEFNSLSPNDNMYFVRTDDVVGLETFPTTLKSSKLRVNNVVIPLHFEYLSTNKKGKSGFRVGLGGFAGLQMNEAQKLKYSIDGVQHKEKTKNNYRTSNYVYGVSGYVGYNWFSLFAKYNLHPLFKSNPIKEHSISMGIRVGI